MTTEAPIAPSATADDKVAILDLLPDQGSWDEQEYLWLSGRTSRLVEFVDGRIEVVPVPSERHQAISLWLFLAFLAFIRPINGKVFYAPLRMRVGPRNFREPDILLLMSADDPRRGNAYWSGADLVVEIVSPDDRKRDLVTKRVEYAQAGILEYWIVDPQEETITVLRLEGSTYVEHGIFQRGQTATSALLEGFGIGVDETIDAS